MKRLALSTSSWTTSKGGMLASHSSRVETPPVSSVGGAVQLPDRIDDVIVVGVDQMGGVVAVAGEVELDDPLVGQRPDEPVGVHVVVEARHVDVVDVEEQPAVRLLGQAGDELPLVHGRILEGNVGAGVLQHERALQEVLDGSDALHHVAQGLLGERHRQQVVGVAAEHARPAEVVGDPMGLDLLRQPLELAQILEIERVGGADGERYAVHDDGIALSDLLEHIAGPALRVDVVFADDLEPVHRGLVLQDVVEVDGPQPDAEAQVAMSETGWLHSRSFRECCCRGAAC